MTIDDERAERRRRETEELGEAVLRLMQGDWLPEVKGEAKRFLPPLLLGVSYAAVKGEEVSKRDACLQLMRTDVTTTGPKYIKLARELGLIRIVKSQQDRRKDLLQPTQLLDALLRQWGKSIASRGAPATFSEVGWDKQTDRLVSWFLDALFTAGNWSSLPDIAEIAPVADSLLKRLEKFEFGSFDGYVAYCTRAVANAVKGNFARAMADIELARARFPGDLARLIGTRIVAAAKSQGQGLSEVAPVFSNYSEAWLAFAEGQAQESKDSARAINCYRRALELDPSFGYAKKALKRLEESEPRRKRGRQPSKEK